MLIKIARAAVWVLIIVVGVINVVVGVVERESDTLSVGLCAIVVLGVVDYLLIRARSRARSIKELKTDEPKLSRREARKQRHAQLESKASWRLAKVIYSILALALALLALAGTDEYENEGVSVAVAWLIIAVILYPIFKRVVYYVYFGKSDKAGRQDKSHENIV